jgi:hypothetical protein
MKVLHSFKTPETIYQSTWNDIPEYLNLHESHCENLGYCIDLLLVSGLCIKFSIDQEARLVYWNS